MAAALSLDELCELVGGFWPADQVALCDVAAMAGEPLELRFGFDTFGDDGDAEGVREVNGAADDLVVLLVGWDARDEAAVELDLLDW